VGLDFVDFVKTDPNLRRQARTTFSGLVAMMVRLT
jgi:hypothetical protein